MASRGKRRINGCQQPFNSWQVAACTVFFILAGCFQGVYVRVLEPNRVLRNWCINVHLVSAAIVFVLTSVACIIDPADKGKDDEDGLPGNYCALCRLVVHKDSKHCRACDKCVRSFDHHCRWLNNCVGKRNYRTFFMLVLCTLFHVTFIAAISVYLFVASVTVDDPPDHMRNTAAATSWKPKYASRQGIERALEDAFGSTASIESFMVGLCLMFVVCMTAALLLGELFLFHCVLVARGMTTYDYIMVEKQRVDPSLARSNSLVRSQSRQNSGRRSPASSSPSSSSGVTQVCICCDSSANRVMPSDVSGTRRNGATRKKKVRINPCQLLRAEKNKAALGDTKGAATSGNGVVSHKDSSVGGDGLNTEGIQDPDQMKRVGNGIAAKNETTNVPGGTDAAASIAASGNDERVQSTSLGEHALHRGTMSSRALEMTRSQRLPPLKHCANGNGGSIPRDVNDISHVDTPNDAAQCSGDGDMLPPPASSTSAASDENRQQRAPREGSPPHRMPSCSPPSKSYEVADDDSDPMVVTPTMTPRKTSSPAPMLPSPLHWPAATSDARIENGQHNDTSSSSSSADETRINGMMMSRV